MQSLKLLWWKMVKASQSLYNKKAISAYCPVKLKPEYSETE